MRHHRSLRRDFGSRAPSTVRQACFAHGADDSQAYGPYFYTCLAQQFDAVMHIDESSEVQALDEGQVWSEREASGTFPSGIQPSRKCDENQRY